MARVVSKGCCSFCQRSFTKTGMTRHLPSCAARPDELALGISGRKWPTRVFHLVVSTRFPSEYWLQVEAVAEATLDDLDGLLRSVWVECCDHLSDFRLGERTFFRSSERAGWSEDQPTSIALGQLVSPGQELQYRYDFGSTTELTIRVSGERQGRPPEHIAVIARNDSPLIPCSTCGAAAAYACLERRWSARRWLSDGCAASHSHDEDARMRVVNSPRTGVCGGDAA